MPKGSYYSHPGRSSISYGDHARQSNSDSVSIGQADRDSSSKKQRKNQQNDLESLATDFLCIFRTDKKSH